MRKLDGSVVMTSVRNEGPFLLEWLAWYRMLGFDHALVLHNDCTDHSPQLLRLLERSGFLTQKKQQPPADEPPKSNAYRIADKHPLIRDSTWAFVCDVDEFLVVNTGDRSAAALAEVIAPDHMGMAIHWLIYGSAGTLEWRDGLVHRMFQRSGTGAARQNSCFKTFYRQPGNFAGIRSHGPEKWRGDGDWNTGPNGFILADGSRLTEYTANYQPPNSTVHPRMTHDLAQVNHYAVQSVEKYDLKRPHLSPAANLERYTDDFFQRFDRNEVENPSALAYAADFDAAYAEITAVDGVLRLHHLCCADFVERSCLLHGFDPKGDPRFIEHMDKARSLPRH